MKKFIVCLSIVLFFFACNSETKPTAEAAADTSTKESAASVTPVVTMPYTPMYVTLTDEVSDQDLLTTLNSYKYWENGDISGIRSTLADSINFQGWQGFNYNGSSDDLMKIWEKSRDSLSSVRIHMIAWRKQHSVERNEDWVSVWYDEVDTYKTGKVDSASFQDDNLLVKGKIAVYSQHKQVLPKK